MWITLLVVLFALAALGALAVLRPRLQTNAELGDAPGMRSTLVFQVVGSAGTRDEADEDGGSVPPPAVLDAIAASLEAAGADASHWTTLGGVLEMHGMLGVDTFKLTLGALEGGAFLLVVHTRTLGRTRWVAPPATDAMRTVLVAVDRGVRAAPGVLGVVWRRRQDDVTAEGARPTPCD